MTKPEVASAGLEVPKSDLREDPKRLQSDLEHIREWLSKQHHIHAPTDDKTLLIFLRGCKYSLERTKEKIDSYYTMRSAAPEILGGKDPMAPEIQEILTQGLMFPLGFDAQDRRVCLARFGKMDSAKVKIEDFYKVGSMVVDMVLDEDEALVANGQVAIMDMEDWSMSHTLLYTPALIKKIVTIMQESYPVRPKGFHFINVPSYFETTFKIFKMFLKEKLTKRIHFHSELKKLYQHIPRDLLPEEYGGKSGTLAEITETHKKKTEERRDFFLRNEKFRVDESKRPGRPKTHSDLFGVEGAFRQISFD